MSSLLISLKDVSIAFGSKPLFEGISFNIHEKDRICLVGRNGTGKSTLFKIIMQQLTPDEGELWFKPNMTIGYLPQKISFQQNDTIYGYIEREAEIDASVGEEFHYKADMILEPFYLNGMQRMSELSGGQLRRVALASCLINEPHLLLLDEPTNHLDIRSIEWLEQFLQSYNGAMICISHDRKFLSDISNKTLWLDKQKIKVNNKGYQDFEKWSEALIELEYNAILKMNKKLAEEEHWHQRGVTARRKRNVRRLKELKTLRADIKARQSVHKRATGKVALPPLSPKEANKLIIEMEHASKCYGETKIMDCFSTRIMKNDKVGIVGRNGSGKSTFLKILTGSIDIDSGRLRRGKTLIKFQDDISYFDQNRESLNEDNTLWEALCPGGGDQVYLGQDRHRHVIGYLKDFMFDPAQARAKVKSLSGGESNRLLLSKILANPKSVLILDEPTNDLDTDTLDMLQEMLADYKGTLIIVSHDRDFLDRTVSKLIVFEGDGDVVEYIGGYSDYLEAKKQEKAAALQKKKDKSSKGSKAGSDNVSKTSNTSSSNLSYKYKHALETLPDEIDRLVVKIKEQEQILADPELYIADPEKFDRVNLALQDYKQNLVKAEDSLLEAEIMQEELLNNQN